jgi:hypothetical protein
MNKFFKVKKAVGERTYDTTLFPRAPLAWVQNRNQTGGGVSGFIFLVCRVHRRGAITPVAQATLRRSAKGTGKVTIFINEGRVAVAFFSSPRHSSRMQISAAHTNTRNNLIMTHYHLG